MDNYFAQTLGLRSLILKPDTFLMRFLWIIGLLAAMGVIGVFWSVQVSRSLGGLGPSFPRSPEEQVQVILDRTAFRLVPPEWIGGPEVEGTWVRYEVAARLGLVFLLTSVLLGTAVRAQRNEDSSHQELRKGK